MQVDLFAGIPVREHEEALAWYKRLLGSEPSFAPHATEAVWELAEHRFLFIVEGPEHAGHAMHTIFVGDLDAMVAEIAARGIQPARDDGEGRPRPQVHARALRLRGHQHMAAAARPLRAGHRTDEGRPMNTTSVTNPILVRHTEVPRNG